MSLVGIISNLPQKICDKLIEKMCKTIQHESFYNSGVFSSNELKIYVGWTTHKHSFSDCMPIVNERHNIFLFITGEVFLDPEEIIELQHKGHIFNKDDASYLVHLYEELGEEFFKKLNGQFSGVLIDKQHNISFLFNDRFGIQRIFTYQNNDSFFFSSEAKAILAVNIETRDFNSKGVLEFLTCGCTLGEHSLFKGIKVLPGGTCLEFKKGILYRKNQYFEFKKWESQKKFSIEDFTSRFIEKFNNIINRYILPEGKVALSITGGIDSRLVIAAANPSPNSFPCYTFSSKTREPYDVKIGRKIALKFKQPYNTIILDDKFIDNITDNLEKTILISDGYIGIEGAVELYINSIARSIKPIRLTGNYGSELLRGIRLFRHHNPRDNLLKPETHKKLKEIGDFFYSINNSYNNLSFVSFFQAPFHHFGRRSIEQSQITLRTPFLDNDLLALLYKAPDTINGFTISRKIVESKNSDLLKIYTDRGYWGKGSAFIKLIRRLFLKGLFKAEIAFGINSPNWIIKGSNLLKVFNIESLFLNRHKFFSLRLLIRDYLKNYIKDILLTDKNLNLYSFIDWKIFKVALNNHILQKCNYTTEIDRILTLALTERIFFK